jgi:hypothetical protein
MKNALIATALVLSSAALAQTNAPPAPNGQGAHNGPQGQQQEQRFEEIKARHLDHIAKRIAQLQQVQSCVQAAANPEALRACRPQQQAQ